MNAVVDLCQEMRRLSGVWILARGDLDISFDDPPHPVADSGRVVEAGGGMEGLAERCDVDTFGDSVMLPYGALWGSGAGGVR